MHFDSDETLDGRRVTAIMYLNQEWKPSHGGELRLYPFPGPPVDVEPLQDRLVLFSSTRMLHRWVCKAKQAYTQRCPAAGNRSDALLLHWLSLCTGVCSC